MNLIYWHNSSHVQDDVSVDRAPLDVGYIAATSLYPTRNMLKASTYKAHQFLSQILYTIGPLNVWLNYLYKCTLHENPCKHQTITIRPTITMQCHVSRTASSEKSRQ